MPLLQYHCISSLHRPAHGSHVILCASSDLLNRMFVVEPSKRLDMKQVLDHPWVKGEVLPADSLKADLLRRKAVVDEQKRKELQAKMQARAAAAGPTAFNTFAVDEMSRCASPVHCPPLQGVPAELTMAKLTAEDVNEVYDCVLLALRDDLEAKAVVPLRHKGSIRVQGPAATVQFYVIDEVRLLCYTTIELYMVMVKVVKAIRYRW